ncbi:hypothetical protein SS50377_23333 [Spironucleus salmonicida]|nr:hypothetical protein SS50377_23333 [Spironucleus salmonicida]
MRQEKQLLKEDFYNKLNTYRNSVEKKIINMQKAYASSLLNVIRNRELLNQKCDIKNPIPEEQHNLEILSYKTKLEQELRGNIEKTQLVIMNITSERDQLKNKIEVLELQNKALILQLEKNNTNKAGSVQQIQEHDSSENFELSYQVSTGMNTNLVPDQVLQQNQTKDIVLNLPGESDKSISTSVIPWLIASETTNRILSDRHQKLLEHIQTKENQLTKLMSTVTKQSYQVIKYQNMAQVANQEQQLIEIQISHLQQNEKVLEKKNQKLIQKKDEQIKEISLQIDNYKLLNIRQSKQLEIYEEQIKSSKNTFFEEFQLLERMEENQKIGYLQNQVIYLSNFEKIYAKTLSDLTKRNKSLQQSNEELRMYNIQFNAKLYEVQQSAEEKVTTQFKQLLDSYEQQQSSYHTEISDLKFNLDSKCHEIQLILQIESKLKAQIETLKQQNDYLFESSLQQQTQIVNLFAQYKILKRQFVTCINDKQNIKEQANNSIDIINSQKDQFITMQIDNEILVNALKTSIQTIYQKLYSKKCDDYLQEIILKANQVQTNESLEQIQLQVSYEIDKALPNLYQLKVLKQDNQLTLLEKQVLDQNSLDHQERFKCDFSQTTQVSIAFEQQSELKNQQQKIITKTVDFGQKVEFHTDQIFLLQEAYREIASLKQQLTDYNSQMKRFGHIKQKIFEECYYEDIEMVRQNEHNMLMTNEDILMQQYRYKNLYDEWSIHKCPTFLDFKPQVDQLLHQLKEVKDQVIFQLDSTIQIRDSQITTLNIDIQFLNDKYSRLKDYLLISKYDMQDSIQSFTQILDNLKQKSLSIIQLGQKLNTLQQIVQFLVQENSARKSQVYLQQYVQTDLVIQKDSTKRNKHTELLYYQQRQKDQIDSQTYPDTANNISNIDHFIPSQTNSKTDIREEHNITNSIVQLDAQFKIDQQDYESLILVEQLAHDSDNNTTHRIISSMEFQQKQLNNTSISSIDQFILDQSSFNNKDGTSNQDFQSYVNFNDIEQLLLSQQENHNALITELALISKNQSDMQVDKVQLERQLQNKTMIIQTLREEITKNKEEFRYKFVHRPSKEEDIAQIKYLSKQLDSYKSWYQVVSQENTKLIKQIDISEKQINTFFGTMYKTSNQGQLDHQNDISKEKLIEQRKHSDSKINKLFIQEDFQGGLQNMSLAKFEDNDAVQQKIKKSQFLISTTQSRKQLQYQRVDYDQQILVPKSKYKYNQNNNTSQRSISINSQRQQIQLNKHSQFNENIEKQRLKQLEQILEPQQNQQNLQQSNVSVVKMKRINELQTQNEQLKCVQNVAQQFSSQNLFNIKYSNQDQQVSKNKQKINTTSPIFSNKSEPIDVMDIGPSQKPGSNKNILYKPISIWNKINKQPNHTKNFNQNVYYKENLSTQNLSNLLKYAVDNMGQFEKEDTSVPNLTKAQTKTVYTDDDQNDINQQVIDEKVAWVKGGYQYKSEHQNTRFKNLRYQKQLPGTQ